MSDIEARISGEAPATAAAVVNAPPIPRQPTRSVSVERPDKRAKTAEVGETPEGSATSDETTAQLMNKSVVLYEVPASTSAGEYVALKVFGILMQQNACTAHCSPHAHFSPA